MEKLFNDVERVGWIISRTAVHDFVAPLGSFTYKVICGLPTDPGVLSKVFETSVFSVVTLHPQSEVQEELVKLPADVEK